MTGAWSGIWTHGLQISAPLLYRLSYPYPKDIPTHRNIWCIITDSLGVKCLGVGIWYTLCTLINNTWFLNTHPTQLWYSLIFEFFKESDMKYFRFFSKIVPNNSKILVNIVSRKTARAVAKISRLKVFHCVQEKCKKRQIVMGWFLNDSSFNFTLVRTQFY